MQTLIINGQRETYLLELVHKYHQLENDVSNAVNDDYTTYMQARNELNIQASRIAHLLSKIINETQSQVTHHAENA